MKRLTGSLCLIFVCSLIVPDAVGRRREPIRVTYISAEAVYIDAGKRAGLAVGDVLEVTDRRAGARLVITNISSHSAACKTVDSRTDVRVGDTVIRIRRRRRRFAESVARRSSRSARTSRWRQLQHPRRNRISGFLSFQTQWQRDLNGDRLSWFQPGVNGRLVIENIAGKDLAFRLRHHSYRNIRSRSIDTPFGKNGWVHRLSEASLLFGAPDSHVQMGIGRVLSPHISGIGYLDGGYFSIKVNPAYRIGAVVGTVPDRQSSGYRSDHRTFGGFVAYERGSYRRHHLASTLALSASYAAGEINREFVYLQNRYHYARRFTAYQSVEVDINRQWRRSVSDTRVSFSNFYLTSNLNIGSFATVDASFDARKQIWDYTTMNTPDSLFDHGLRRGIDGGISLRLPKGFGVRANAGIRYGDDDSQEIRFSSLYLSVRNFLHRGHHLSARLSRSVTPTTRAYRPTAIYRLALARRTRLSLSAGGYLYETRGIENNSYFLELGAERTIGRRYYGSGSWRQYLGGSLQSIHLTAEVGMNF